ncbi:SDR family NAD(P)-dependent oxidoreductase [Sporosarcina sp. ACRSM]|nr:SDR family NAD(P)-dependent oxidoreductase [Sporosarcina sp. ACRSM]MCG7336236.1 SDR family NAD(P)-dependent oxidoreductase [Sporosarcina sp. ACRSM]
MAFCIMRKRKSILVTGATSGVGFALTKRLLAEGHAVWATGRAVDALTELRQAGALTIRADLSEQQDLDHLVAQISSPDVVIFSAGIGTFDYAYETSDKAIQDTMDLNVVVPMRLTKRLLPSMMERKQGQLIYLGSQAGKVSTPKSSIYAASKHAMIGYTNGLRMELEPFGIDVTSINPGPIDTPFLDLADKTGHYRQSIGKHLLMVEQVVDAIMKTIDNPVREVNLPWYMGITSKLYAVAPALVERLGRKFFMKK